MPKIFLIKDRLHQQQLRLQESQSLIHSKNQLNIEDNNAQQQQKRVEDVQEPLSLVAKKRIIDENPQTASDLSKNDSGEFKFKFIYNFFSLFFALLESLIYYVHNIQMPVPFLSFFNTT